MIAVPFYADLIRVTLRGTPFPDVERAVSLLLGTCAQESAFTYTQQIGGGPALGFMQIEPPTETSIWADYLAYRPDLLDVLFTRCGRTGPEAEGLQHDMVYGILLARVLYLWRDPERLPAVTDVEEQAVRYKQYYNTPAGAATEEQYIDAYTRLVAPYYLGARR